MFQNKELDVIAFSHVKGVKLFTFGYCNSYKTTVEHPNIHNGKQRTIFFYKQDSKYALEGHLFFKEALDKDNIHDALVVSIISDFRKKTNKDFNITLESLAHILINSVDGKFICRIEDGVLKIESDYPDNGKISYDLKDNKVSSATLNWYQHFNKSKEILQQKAHINKFQT